MMDDDTLYEVQTILGKRKTQTGCEYLVKWKNFPIDESTWEVTKNLQAVKSLVRDYETKLKRSREKNKIQLVYDNKSDYKRLQNNRNLKFSGYLMNICNKQKQLKANRNKEEGGQNIDKEPLKILGMHREKSSGKLWYYYEKYAVRGWTSRDFMLKNYPDELCNFYIRNIVTKKQMQNEYHVIND